MDRGVETVTFEKGSFRSAGNSVVPDRFTPEERDTLLFAAETLDDLWDFDASRSQREARGSVEYEEESTAVKIRAIIEGPPSSKGLTWAGLGTDV
jgi:hypothetical protein